MVTFLMENIFNSVDDWSAMFMVSDCSCPLALIHLTVKRVRYMASIQDVSSARTSPLNLRCDQTATVGNSPLVLLGVCALFFTFAFCFFYCTNHFDIGSRS